jgi:ABC-type oligopeptide transport system substrate-binding subunit
LAMSSMQSLFEKVAEKNNLKLATGLIPDGIPGSLRNRPKLVSLDTAAIQDRSFNIAVLAREFRYINDKNLIDAVDKEFRVKINVFSVESKDISDLPKKRPDVFILGLAGSFYDPEGFLDLLSSCLAADAKSIFAENYDLYKTAGNESDWNTRAPIYQDLSQKIQTNFTMVPGWKIAAVRLMNPQLEFDQNDLRYTPKLKDYRFRKEDQ